MLNNIIIFYLALALLVPVVQIHAFTGDTELVLENVGLVPAYPTHGDLVSITADVYNIGLKNTDSVTSMITVAYFVDGDLLYVDNIDNILPGLSNKVIVTSPPIWKSETGPHEITVVVDYHDTLNDKYDSPFDNSVTKKLFINFAKDTQILLEADPQFFLLDETISKITVSLFDPNSNDFLDDQKIILNLNGNNSTLITDGQGKVSFSSTMSSSNPVDVNAYFDGNGIYSSSNSSITLYPFPKDVSSSLVLQIPRLNPYNFEDHSFEILIYQDSYEKLIKKIHPDFTTLFDSKTFWISLSSGHHYFVEIYLDGRLFSVTDKNQLGEHSVIVKKLNVPEMGKIKFVVTDDKTQFVTEAVMDNRIHSFSTDNGFVEWVDVFPATVEPYVAKVILSDQRTIESKPFLVFPGEHKIIDITTRDILSKSEIPSWIKNNAGWWADDLIDDSSFVDGIQFLIQEGLISVPLTTINSDKNNSEIPSWIKNNAGWWADDLIDDSSFVDGIQFLIQEGLIKPS